MKNELTRRCNTKNLQTLSSNVKEGRSLWPKPSSIFRPGSLSLAILNNSPLRLGSVYVGIGGIAEDSDGHEENVGYGKGGGIGFGTKPKGRPGERRLREKPKGISALPFAAVCAAGASVGLAANRLSVTARSKSQRRSARATWTSSICLFNLSHSADHPQECSAAVKGGDVDRLEGM